MNYIKKVIFLSELSAAIADLPLVIQKYIGTYYNNKYDNRYIKTIVPLSKRPKKLEQVMNCHIEHVHVGENIKYNDYVQIILNNNYIDHELSLTNKKQSKQSKQSKQLKRSKYSKQSKQIKKIKQKNNTKKYKSHIIYERILRQNEIDDDSSLYEYWSECECVYCKKYS